jgi:cyanate lyase
MQERDRQELLRILRELKVGYRLSPRDTLRLLSTDKVMVPAGLFSLRRLGIMEANVKYLREDLGLGLSEIARMLGRDPRTVWVMYHQATLKMPERFEVKPGISIPISVFVGDSSPLKAIVSHLRHVHGLKFKDIGQILGRDTALVCTVYNRK